MTTNDRLYRVMYLSEATRTMSEEDLDGLLEHARGRNRGEGIGGLLLYDAGYFAQILEGPMDRVGALMERIQLDLRHRRVVVLSAGPADARYFKDWGMAWTNLGRLDLSEHAALRRYMRSHHIADAQTVVDALVLFAREHAQNAG